LYNSGPVGKATSKVRLTLASDEWLVACVRRGDTAAFETLYDRHVRELLGFCVYMLGSKHDAEDALQATFASAYRAMRADSRPVTLRPWLFTIARNNCLTILRRRRPLVELNGEVAPGPDPVTEIETREEVRKVFEGLRDLPESQRAALVLAEVHGLSQQEIGGVLGVRADQVKAYVYQARSKLISERRARDADCREIREELASARGAALLRGRLRRHVRSCPDCRLYADGVARQRRQLGALLPVVPSLGLKYRALEETLSFGGGESATVAGGAAAGASVAGAAADLAGGGMKVLVCKLAVGVVCLGAGGGVGVSVLEAPGASQGLASSGTTQATDAALVASAQGRGGAPSWSRTVTALAGEVEASGTNGGGHGSQVAGLPQLEAGAGGASGTGGKKNGAPASDSSGGRGGTGSAGGESVKSGREVHGLSSDSEHGSRRETTQERVQLKHEARERNAEQRKLRREESKGTKVPPTEAELAERKEHHRLKIQENRPIGMSKQPHKTAQEYAERHERNKRLKEEKRRREREEEAAAPPG